VTSNVKFLMMHPREAMHGSPLAQLKAALQKYSLPLLFGLVTAVLWNNVDKPSYRYVCGLDAHHHGDALQLPDPIALNGHPITLHFLVNDIFMAFFFGLATKEVVESVLPGGSLFPISKAGHDLEPVSQHRRDSHRIN
jgi:NhaA family Na+:H+ antiporter